MTDRSPIQSLAQAMGVYTQYTDGLNRDITVGPETLVRVCAAAGAPVDRLEDAAEALREIRARDENRTPSPVIVAWDGILPDVTIPEAGPFDAELLLEDGEEAALERTGDNLHATHRLPPGYHRLTVHASGKTITRTVIVAPTEAWRLPGSSRSWGLSGQLAALRSARSRSLGDLRDLESVCQWVGDLGGDLVMVLPLLPTFNVEPPEPSPYSPVSRLFWSELILDLGSDHRPTGPVQSLDVMRADAEVRPAIAALPDPDPSLLTDELRSYARFRGAQIRMCRNWRDWPARARNGQLELDQIDPAEERFHLVAQTAAHSQLNDLRRRMDNRAFRLGMDLAVGVHPDGYDPWSRQSLFATGMSVGAPPDMGFPSGQDWGFPPILPEASRLEGHRYFAASIAHQAAISGVLRVDHIMAWTRLYWIPHGFAKSEGTYVSYPAEELFAVLTLESHRNSCEIVGENLGTVPREIGEALPRHRIRGMYLAQFQAEKDPAVAAPTAADVALVNTHDTPTFAGWLAGVDIDERVRCGLVSDDDEPRIREERSRAARRLAERLGCDVDRVRPLLIAVLEWLGRSDSPLVVPWIEDLWLEDQGVNLPATRSSERPNWQRAMRKLLDEIFTDPDIAELVRRLDGARNAE